MDDVFVMELVRVERLGPCMRLSFATEQVVPGTDPPQYELAIKAKIIIPVSSVGVVSTKLMCGEEIEINADLVNQLRTAAGKSNKPS